jgi:arsenite methyltransferase
MQDSSTIPAEMGKFYEKALRSDEPGCCGPKTTVPVLALDYSADQLASLPIDAIANSFGCGNPLAFAEVKAGQTVLDLGSGAGIDLIIAAEAVGPTGAVIGVDVSPEMIERAKANVARAGHENVTLFQSEIEDLPLPDSSIDWVVSNCVINLSPDKPRVFAEIARVMRPGGRMLVSDIIAHDLPDWVLDNSDLYAACISGALTEADYLGAAEAAGLADVHVVDRLVYDGAMIATLIADQLPVAIADLVDRMAFTDEGALMDFVIEQFDGKIESVKVAATLQ